MTENAANASAEKGAGQTVRGNSPRVGQNVLYRKRPGDPGSDCEFFPAVVTRVFSESCVNITVFPDCASPFNVGSVQVGNPGGYIEVGA